MLLDKVLDIFSDIFGKDIVNLSTYKKIENQWANAISNGQEVTVKVDIKYSGDSLRPTELDVEYTIDGEFFNQDILN